MNPRIKSIEDYKKGIPNKDQWNHTQPPSEADKKRFWYLNLFINFLVCSNIMLNYLTFSDRAPYKQINDFTYQYILPKSVGQMGLNDFINEDMINIIPKVALFCISGLPYTIYYHIK